MKTSLQHTIYNASAGSGKTYTLARDFIAILLTQKNPFYFRYLLAITFTNKAAAEMKHRILENLLCFSKRNKNNMFKELIKQTGLDEETIIIRSKNILEAISQDYSSFNITTLDSFTHQIIRTFSFDFGLTSDFRIELDAEKILQEAVDLVITQIGIDETLTDFLVKYAIKKSDDDKAWDISKELYDFSKILLNESDKYAFQSNKHLDITAYQSLQKKLISSIKKMESRMKEIGKSAVQIIEDEGLENSNFLNGTLPKHFHKLITNWEKADFFDKSTLKKNFEEDRLYAKSQSQIIKDKIDRIKVSLLDLYNESEKMFIHLTLQKLWIESLFPMAVLSYVQKAMIQIKNEQNIQLISDFNEIIQEKVQNEPAPFIYERLGERFKHYFIDEMQDTSVLQWQNLISLIHNALSQQGTLLQVGDAKQCIYRWRGSVPEQFIDLSDMSKESPFYINRTVHNLGINYRSFTEIIDFNNRFFTFSAKILNNNVYKKLYEEHNNQLKNAKIGGYVQIEFLENINKQTDEESDDHAEEKDIRFPKKVLETIQNLDAGFKWKDVCVLVRKNDHGIAVAQYLTDNGIDILSSESLLLSKNTYIDFIINLLEILYNPLDKKTRHSVLDFVYNHFEISTLKHDFFNELIHLSADAFYIKLGEYSVVFDDFKFYQKSLYDGIEYIIRCFNLNQTSDVYLQFFLDFILDFQVLNGSDLHGFLEYWELKKEKLSISIPEGKNAVSIMTVHKAKGLEFPVVILPYGLDIYKTKNSKVWYNIENPEDFEGFQNLLISLNLNLQYTDNEGTKIFKEFKQKQELDSTNILYVALTRAVEQLYILTDYGLNAKGNIKENSFSGMLASFLQDQNVFHKDQYVYAYGDKKKVHLDAKEEECSYIKPQRTLMNEFVSFDATENHLIFHTTASALWDSDQEKAIQYGNLIHTILAQINTADDLEMVLNKYVSQGIVMQSDVENIKHKFNQIFSHPKLRKYFDLKYMNLCEREIFTTEGQTFKPDRIVFFNQNEVGILEYKTGLPKIEHHDQILNYASRLSEMNYTVKEQFIVYLDDPISVV